MTHLGEVVLVRREVLESDLSVESLPVRVDQSPGGADEEDEEREAGENHDDTDRTVRGAAFYLRNAADNNTSKPAGGDLTKASIELKPENVFSCDKNCIYIQ